MVGSVALDLLYVTEIPLDTKTGLVKQQFPVHLQLNESKVRLSPSGAFDEKKSERFKDIMRHMKNWLAQMKTRSQLKHS